MENWKPSYDEENTYFYRGHKIIVERTLTPAKFFIFKMICVMENPGKGNEDPHRLEVDSYDFELAREKIALKIDRYLKSHC